MENYLYSNIELTLINLMASNYNRIREKETSIKIFKKLMIILDNDMLNNPYRMYDSLNFENNLYQSTAHNLSRMYMKNKQYEDSLNYINKGISFSTKQNYMKYLPELLAQKSRLLLEMDLKQDSYETYQMCLSFYKLCKNEDETKEITREFKDNFPNKNL